MSSSFREKELVRKTNQQVNILTELEPFSLLFSSVLSCFGVVSFAASPMLCSSGLGFSCIPSSLIFLFRLLPSPSLSPWLFDCLWDFPFTSSLASPRLDALLLTSLLVSMYTQNRNGSKIVHLQYVYNRNLRNLWPKPDIIQCQYHNLLISVFHYCGTFNLSRCLYNFRISEYIQAWILDLCSLFFSSAVCLITARFSIQL